ncbi:MAG: hypothetical protein WA705_02445 [Candidatus Ozemobacteraceae bacterium]
MHRTIAFLICLCFLATSAWALIGTPCDPDKDFTDLYLIDHWKVLPHKNQEESKERVDQVNTKLGRPAWKYDPTPNKSVYECLSYGASTVADWWAAEYGWKPESYTSYTHGGKETGFNPRKLELRYRHRSKMNPLQYPLVGIKADDRCPVTGEWVPITPAGFARLLVESDPDSLVDPIDGVTFTYAGGNYPFEGKWVSIIGKNWNKKNAEQKLIQAIRDFGPLYIQFEMPNKHFLFGTHGPVVIGYGKVSTSTVFIVHDSYGDFPKEHKQDDKGANAYRYIVADEIDEAFGFPHRPVVRAVRSPKGIQVSIMNLSGKPLHVRRIRWIDAAGKEQEMDMSSRSSYLAPASAVKEKTITVSVEADYYMDEDGAAQRVTVPIVEH